MEKVSGLHNVKGTYRRNRNPRSSTGEKFELYGVHMPGNISGNSRQDPGRDSYQQSSYNDDRFTSYSNKGGRVKVSGGIHSTHILFSSDIPHPEISRIHNYMKKTVRFHTDGLASNDEVAEMIGNMYEDLIALNVVSGKTHGNDPHFNRVLLRDTHTAFIMRTLDVLWYDNQMEGYEFSKSSRVKAAGLDRFVYYNAKYFYANLALQEIGDTAALSIAKGEGFSEYSVTKVRSEIHPYNYCFNNRWSFEAEHNQRASKLKTLKVYPPVDFFLFYAPNQIGSELIHTNASIDFIQSFEFYRAAKS